MTKRELMVMETRPNPEGQGELWRYESPSSADIRAYLEDNPELELARELAWLTWFCQRADFGPADEDVQRKLRRDFERQTGRRVPKGWRYDEEG